MKRFNIAEHLVFTQVYLNKCMKLTFGGGAGWFYANMHETISEPSWGCSYAVLKCMKLTLSPPGLGLMQCRSAGN